MMWDYVLYVTSRFSSTRRHSPRLVSRFTALLRYISSGFPLPIAMASSGSWDSYENPYTGYPRHRDATSSTQNPSRWTSPGIYMNLEFGVSFSHRDAPHTANFKYATRGMEERMLRQHQSQQPQPAILMQPYGQLQQQQQQPHRERAAQPHHQHPQPALRTQRRRLGVRGRYPHERGRSAPPTLEERHLLNPPVRPVHTGSFPLEERERDRPLPPLPSTFRLGEPDLPWATPTFVPSPTPSPSESEYEDPTTLSMRLDGESLRGEDPQRVRDMETLHQAMMTIDSLEEGGWDAWSGDSFGDTGMPRGPRGLGWAVSSDDHAPTAAQASVRPPPLAPPPYVVSQWEEMYGGYYRPGRPRSSG
ncbi:hypothetical protein PVAG01_03164 [Phlyctema vagabunda]|uniref:Uncharacterized protein n=1 Tax=Phlyctema vagabunda TaxID=108571 RepID=A0ABR4PSQ5_9HELO